jgi:hypothetical protein
MRSILPLHSLDNPLLAAALTYAARDWPVLPLHTPDEAGRCSCQKPKCAVGKHPRTRNGYYDATTDKGIIEAWWQKWPDANVGIRVGAEAGIVALDVDPRNHGDAMLEVLQDEHGRLPETLVVFTGGNGQHHYFKAPTIAIKGGNSVLGPGLDVKAAGHVVAPPSLHKSGQRYEFEAAFLPGETPLAELPAWMIERLQAEQCATCEPKNGGKYCTSRQIGQSPSGSSGPPSKKVKQVIPGFTCFTFPEVKKKDEDTRWVKHVQATDFAPELLNNDDIRCQIALFLGLPERIGQTFQCILPGHRDDAPSCTLYVGRDQRLQYHDFHARHDARQWWAMPEVYAATTTGHLATLSKPSMLTWQIRLLVDAKIVDPAFVPHRPLPANVKASVRKTYQGLIHLFACKWLYDYGKPSSFSWRFAEGWCGVSVRMAGEATQWLLANGYIRIVEKYRRTALFLPVPPPEEAR